LEGQTAEAELAVLAGLNGLPEVSYRGPDVADSGWLFLSGLSLDVKEIRKAWRSGRAFYFEAELRAHPDDKENEVDE
jgi:hypothetical protein